MTSPRRTVEYVPLEKAAKPWDICVSFPHMKDAYWLAVDYGVVAESERLGVRMQLVEAGSYTNLNSQISQIEDCVARGADAVVIGAISFDGLNNLVTEIRAGGTPVIDVINGMSSPELSAKSLVSFGEMGFKVGEYIAKAHPVGSGKVKVAWFPGPPGTGWVEAGNRGFQEAVAGSDIEVVETKYGDTGKEVQLKLVEDTLEAHPDIQYVVGTAVTAEAAVGTTSTTSSASGSWTRLPRWIWPEAGRTCPPTRGQISLKEGRAISPFPTRRLRALDNRRSARLRWAKKSSSSSTSTSG